jgi:hypothetical protein
MTAPTTPPAPTVVVVSGNPRPGSRTLGTVTEAQLADLDTVIDAWLGRAGEPLRRGVTPAAVPVGASAGAGSAIEKVVR